MGIALQVLTCLPDRNSIGEGPVYRIASHEVALAAGEGRAAPGRDALGVRVSPKDPAGKEARRPKRFLNAKEAFAYVGISAKTLNRMRAPGKGPRYTKRGRRVIYDVVDLDEWMEEGKTPPHE